MSLTESNVGCRPLLMKKPLAVVSWLVGVGSVTGPELRQTAQSVLAMLPDILVPPWNAVASDCVPLLGRFVTVETFGNGSHIAGAGGGVEPSGNGVPLGKMVCTPPGGVASKKLKQHVPSVPLMPNLRLSIDEGQELHGNSIFSRL